MALCGTMYGSMCDVADPTYEHQEEPGWPSEARVPAVVRIVRRADCDTADRIGNVVVLRLLYDQGKRPTLKDLGYLYEQIVLICA